MKRESNTKERIEQISLDLFAKYGYHAVSIRDICKELGFTESSIYYHFKNKQAIMDSLLQKIEHLMDEKIVEFDLKFDQATEITAEEVAQVAVAFLTKYYGNAFINKMISMLTLERMSDAHAYEVYQRIVFELPLAQQEKIFGLMMERDFIRKSNPKCLAVQYHSMIYLAFQRHCIGMKAEKEISAETIEELRENIYDFYLRIQC